MDIKAYNKKFAKTFSKNLRSIIYEQGKTQTEVANDLKINKSTMSSWMNGKRVPPMEKIDILCAYFHCKRSRLTDEDHASEDGAEMTTAMQALIEAAAGCTPEQIQTATILLNTLKAQSQHGGK